MTVRMTVIVVDLVEANVTTSRPHLMPGVLKLYHLVENSNSKNS